MFFRFITFFICLCVLSFIFISCSKKDPAPGKFNADGTRIAGEGMITVENVNDRLSVELPSQAIFESGGITIITTNLDGTFIKLRTDGVTEGNYPVEYTSNYGVYRFSSNSGILEFKSGGSITIMSIDRNKRTVSGKYSISKYEAAYAYKSGSYTMVVSGEFNDVPYTVPNIASTMSAIVHEYNDSKQIQLSSNAVKVTSTSSLVRVIAPGSGRSEIEMTISTSVESGNSYKLTSANNNSTAYYTTTGGRRSRVYSDNFGVINITMHDKSKRMIEGSFYFETYYDYISDGKFTVYY